jgi:hypothetical protein
VTTGSGDSRMLGGAPFIGDPTSVSKGSTAAPDSARSKAETPPADTKSLTPPVKVGTPPPGALTVGTAPVTRKKGRRAKLTVKRIDPWSTLKFSFVYGLAGMVVMLVSVIVLYGVVDAMGVISSVRSFLVDISDSGSGPGLGAWLGFSRVMLVTFVLGLVNVVLFTAFATLTAFIYNVCTDIVGGVEVTLAERN